MKLDPTIGPFIQDKPSFTFKRTRSIKDNLVSSEYVGGGTGKRDPCKRMGTFRCGGCPYCQFMNTKSNIKLPDGSKYTPKHFANCKTIGVIYLLMCDCASYYVGKTNQEFWRRAYRHIISMKTCNPSLPLDRHVSNFHSGVFPKLSFLILDRVHPGLRGGDWNKILLQKEQKWIFRLQATRAPGLNDTTSFRPFLEGFTSGGNPPM